MKCLDNYFHEEKRAASQCFFYMFFFYVRTEQWEAMDYTYIEEGMGCIYDVVLEFVREVEF